MHILHLIKTSQGATWAFNMMKDMAALFPDITYSVMVPAGGKHFEDYKKFCKHVIEFDFKPDGLFFKRGKELKKIVKAINPDIIHSWFAQTTLYSRFFLRDTDIPKIFQVVGPAHLENAIFRSGDIKSATNSDFWVATSKYIYHKYREAGVPENRIFLNYAYIDIAALDETKNTVTVRNLKQLLNLSSDTKIIGTASYIYPPKFYQKTGIKGHEILLEAFAKILKKRTDVALVIAGQTFGDNKQYEEKLKKTAAEISRDKIFFTGGYQHIYEVLPNFDVFVYLSKSENLGGVYESLLFQIPTVSSDRGALPELVINGVTGYNVSLDNTDLIAEKIELMLEGNNNFAGEGKRLVEETFDKFRTLNQAYSIYKSLLKQ